MIKKILGLFKKKAPQKTLLPEFPVKATAPKKPRVKPVAPALPKVKKSVAKKTTAKKVK